MAVFFAAVALPTCSAGEEGTGPDAPGDIGGRGASGDATATGGSQGLGGGGGEGGAGGAIGTGTGSATGSGGTTGKGGATGSGGASGSGGATGSGGSSSMTGPCDIYSAGNTPCVAAFSTVRALYGGYNGNLYQVKKADGTTRDIGPLSAGGVANAAAQDAFCSGPTCTISIIYDQSGRGNHLTKAPGGSTVYGPNSDVEAVADALPIKLNGHKAYGVHVIPAPSWTSTGQVGYRNTNTSGIAKGDNPETVYMVTDGTYYNGSCCFDFGNAEMQPVAGGYGTMEAIYFGNCNWWDKGAANGPWIMADLEVGVFNSGNANGSWVTNSNDGPFSSPFVTAMLKGNSATAKTGGPFTLKGGSAQSGGLTTVYDGAYPPSYSPMHRQGGIVLGVGGDNSSTARGNFYEGVMTAGYASTATDTAVQANIVTAGYGK